MLISERIPHKEIAKQFNVSKSIIDLISAGKTWKHIPDPDSYKEKPIRTNTKLNETQVKDIKKLLKANELTYKEIGNLFSVGIQTIFKIKHGKSWKDV